MAKSLVIGDTRTRSVKLGPGTYVVKDGRYIRFDRSFRVDVVEAFEGVTTNWCGKTFEHWNTKYYLHNTIMELPRWWERLMFWRRSKLPVARVVNGDA